MELCSFGHEEVCYECKRCPVCDKIEELNDANEELALLITEIERLKEEQ